MLASLSALHSGSMKRIDWPGAEAGGLALTIAHAQADLEALQRLRFRVFTEDMGAVFPDAVGDRDVDRFDPWCVHFMVRDTAGEGMAIGIRLNCDELLTGGYDTKEAYRILETLAASFSLRPITSITRAGSASF